MGIVQKGKSSSDKYYAEKTVADEVSGDMIVPVTPGRIRIASKTGDMTNFIFFFFFSTGSTLSPSFTLASFSSSAP